MVIQAILFHGGMEDGGIELHWMCRETNRKAEGQIDKNVGPWGIVCGMTELAQWEAELQIVH